MKYCQKKLLSLILGFGTIISFGQEYDDLYFTKKDRTKKKEVYTEMTIPNFAQEVQTTNQKIEVTEHDQLSFLGKQYNTEREDNVSEKSSRYYQPNKTQEDYVSGKKRETNKNPNLVFDNLREEDQNEMPSPQTIINNYYNDRWNRPNWRFGLGWNNWGGNFWSVSYGNTLWNPWYNQWAGNSWGWGGGFYDPYRYSPTYYGNYFGRPVYVATAKESTRRNVVRGSAPTRGSVSSNANTSSLKRNTRATSITHSSYTKQQAKYLNRSRSSTQINRESLRETSSSTNLGSNAPNNISTHSNSSRTSVNNLNFNRANNNRSTRSGSRTHNSTRSRSYSSPSSNTRRSSSDQISTPSRGRSNSIKGRAPSRGSTIPSSGNRSKSSSNRSSSRGRGN